MLKIGMGLIALLIGCVVFISCDVVIDLLKSSGEEEVAKSEPSEPSADVPDPNKDGDPTEDPLEAPDDDADPPEEMPDGDVTSIENPDVEDVEPPVEEPESQ